MKAPSFNIFFLRNVVTRLPRRWRAGLIGLSLFLLQACAGAHVTNVASTTPTTPAPRAILVSVDSTALADAAQISAATTVAPRLQAAIVKRLADAHIAAQPFAAGQTPPGTAVLHVSIRQANPGSSAERFLIGFGMGQAKLEARAELAVSAPAGHASLTRFDTASDSGIKPGLVLPGGIALATGDLIHLAIGGGIDVAMNLNGGLGKPTNSTATAIVKQLRDYYRAAGWVWPGDAAT